jgi:hypothetical protein
MSAQANRLSLMALFLALCSLVLGIAATVEAFAHHPGSHATRKGVGTVWLEAVVTVSDGCTTIGSVALGAPAGVSVPPSAEPVTVRLARPQGAMCTQALGSARSESALTVPAARGSLHLFVLGLDGRVVSSERVPIRP